ncbi:MAG: putative metal-dependent hydrolase [Bacteroidota bacterium]
MDLRYPIGKYEPQEYSERQKDRWLYDLQQLPYLLEDAVLNLDEAQLQTPYREGGWTVHQVVHHVADSHINSLCRMKLTLTEDNPMVKAYEEQLWAELNDTKVLPINVSLTLLHALHMRMYALMTDVKDDQWSRTYVHSATGQQSTLWFLLGLYAWHGQHHVAHITSLRERLGW